MGWFCQQRNYLKESKTALGYFGYVRSLTVSFKAEEGWSPGTIFVRGLAGPWRRFRSFVGTGSWVLGSRSRR